MKYYVTADVHGYFTELKVALTEAGFFEETESHKLIICGDLFDRGEEAFQLQEFLMDLLNKNQLILIRGNHEDLAIDLLNNWNRYSYLQQFHLANGTIETVCQLTRADLDRLFQNLDEIEKAFAQTPYIQKLIPAMRDYYETSKFIFTHGWIPCIILKNGANKEYISIPNWRNANQATWNKARWINGMEAAHNGIIEPDKTIVCGHWNSSFGHSLYEGDGCEFDDNPNFDPYYGEGVIALDACTPLSRKVNCVVIED